MPASAPPVLILAPEPLRRHAIEAALQSAGVPAIQALSGELSDLVFALAGRTGAMAVIDLRGQPPLPPALAPMLRQLAPGARLVVVDDDGAAPPGFDLITTLADLRRGVVTLLDI